MNTYYFDSNSLGHSVYCTEVAHRIKRPVPNDVGPLHPNKTLQETLEKLQNGTLKKSSDVLVFNKLGEMISLFVFPLPFRTEGIRKVPYHYYEAGSRDECAEYMLHESAPYGGHRFITEKSVFAKWAKTHAIKFFNPPWQLS